MGAGHGDSHGAVSNAGQHRGRLLIVLGLTTTYLIAEVVGGILTGSLALLADAGHMLTDVLGLAMALAAIQFAQRPATAARTFGFFRAEILAALINAVVLFGVAAYILWEAWKRFQEPVEVESGPMLIVAVGGLVINIIGAWLLRAGSEQSLNLQGAFLEVVADLLGSVGVIVAAIVIRFTGFLQADPIISVIIGLFILPRTWTLLKGAVDVLLEAAPSNIKVDDVQAAMRSVDGVTDLHDLHVWTITSGFVALSAHVLVSGRDSMTVLNDVREVLHERFGIDHATLQVESDSATGDRANCTVDPRCLTVAGVRGLPPLAERANLP